MNTRRLVPVKPEDDVAFAGRLMASARVRHLPVVDGSRIVGVFTERDYLRHGAETGAEGGLDPVSRFMTAPAVTVSPDDSVAAAAALLLSHRVGCLPVLERGRLVGMLTVNDLFAAEVGAAVPPASIDTPVARLMTREPVVVRSFEPLVEAIALMADHCIRHVPVTDEDGRLVGMVSDRDVRTAIGDPAEALKSDLTEVEELRISTVMTSPAESISADAPLSEAVHRLTNQPIGALVVVDHASRVVGMISYVDVMRSLFDLARGRQVTPGGPAEPAS